MSGAFHRNASKQLSYEMFDVESDAYPRLCRKIAKKFRLKTSSRLIIGMDEIFQDYTDGTVTVGLEWDNWSGFIVVARQPDAEELVRQIADSLSTSATHTWWPFWRR